MLLPYVDAAGAPLPDDPSLTSWSWTWPATAQMIVHDAATGRDWWSPRPVRTAKGRGRATCDRCSTDGSSCPSPTSGHRHRLGARPRDGRLDARPRSVSRPSRPSTRSGPCSRGIRRRAPTASSRWTDLDAPRRGELLRRADVDLPRPAVRNCSSPPARPRQPRPGSPGLVRSSSADGPGQLPVLPDADHPHGEADHGPDEHRPRAADASDRRATIIADPTTAAWRTRRPQHGRDDVDEHVTDDATTDRGDRAEEDAASGRKPWSRALAAPTTQTGRARGHPRVATEDGYPLTGRRGDEAPAAERHHRIGDRAEGGGRHVADQDVADYCAAQGGGERDDYQGEHVQAGENDGSAPPMANTAVAGEVDERQQAGPGGVPDPSP